MTTTQQLTKDERPATKCQECDHSRGRHITPIHGQPLGRCYESGCKCQSYQTLTQSDRTRIHRELQSKTCFCTAKKPVGATFCPAHSKILPAAMLSQLRRSVGNVYVETYLAAREFFKKEGEK